MKVIWISASIFSEQEEKQSGAWQKSLALKLALNKDIELINISYQNTSREVIQFSYSNIKQYGLPRIGKAKRGFPPKETGLLFKKIIFENKPDIIHIWGSENPLKLLAFNQKLPGIKVMSMQGVLGSIADCLLNGLTYRELVSTIGVRELLMRETLFSIKKSFYQDAKIEHEMIKKCKYIITQSEWTESQIKPINSNAQFFRINRVLRDTFVAAKKWNEFEHEKPIIYSAAIGYSLKGLHVLIKSLSIVKSIFPNVELRLAGAVGRKDFFGDGYIRLIIRMINKYGLQKNIIWLGAITADQIVKNLQQSSVFVNPSYIESYSVVVAEAMAVGTPSVLSFAGAMPELAEINKEALFFTPGDYRQCAAKIIKLISDNKLAFEISVNAQKKAEYRNSITNTAAEQIRIYNEILIHERTN